jgi:hypothetical protein
MQSSHISRSRRFSQTNQVASACRFDFAPIGSACASDMLFAADHEVAAFPIYRTRQEIAQL